MHRQLIFCIYLFCFLLVISTKIHAQTPPFSGTIFLNPDIVTPDDPTAFLDFTDAGRGMRTMFDRRKNDWITVNAYLFNARFDDGLSTEIQVNPEFGSTEAALMEAEKYAPIIGQLSTVLRKDAETVWIHKGVQPFGGGNNNILIHTGQADIYVNDGILEETLIHESCHTSLDIPHATSAGWQAAQTADPTFISTYAQEFSDREDIAETFLLYVALRFKADRIDENLKNTILATIPNRIAYFDELMLDMHPLGVISSTSNLDNLGKTEKLTAFPNPFNQQTIIRYQLTQTKIINIALYTYKGQKVQQLLSEVRQNAGDHELILDRKNLPSGIYFLQLVTENQSIVQKLVLL